MVGEQDKVSFEGPDPFGRPGRGPSSIQRKFATWPSSGSAGPVAAPSMRRVRRASIVGAPGHQVEALLEGRRVADRSIPEQRNERAKRVHRGDRGREFVDGASDEFGRVPVPDEVAGEFLGRLRRWRVPMYQEVDDRFVARTVHELGDVEPPVDEPAALPLHFADRRIREDDVLKAADAVGDRPFRPVNGVKETGA